MGYFVKNRGTGKTPNGILIPNGNTSNRSAFPIDGMLRYNTETLAMEYYDGTRFRELIAEGQVDIFVDNFTGDNTTITFNFDTGVDTVTGDQQIIVFINGVYQTPTITYTTTPTSITFSAPPATDMIINVIHNIGKIANAN